MSEPNGDIMKYSITPLTKLFRENDIPTSPLVETEDWLGRQTWTQIEDGYSYSKSRGADYVDFFVRGADVLEKMKEVIESNGYEIKSYHEDGNDAGGTITVDLKQFHK